jgi:hypothetical protein
MPIAFLSRLIVLGLIAWALPSPQQNSADGHQGPSQPAQQQLGNVSAVSPATQKSQKATSASEDRPSEKSAADAAQSARSTAWQLLQTGGTSPGTSTRATAIGVLGLLPRDIRARMMAEKALADQKPEVRSAAAVALGAMHAKASIQKLRDATADPEPSVALAAARSLIELGDDAGYEVYYEVLTGERKGRKGLIASQAAMLEDPKKMAELGIQEGIGFIPFAGMGWEAFKVIHQGDSSQVRAAAAKVLTKDPDPETTKAIERALSDKHWTVRVAALEALAGRGDPSVLDAVTPFMSDDKNAVKYTAAAAVLRLYAVKESGTPIRQKGRTRGRIDGSAEIR